MGFARHAGEDNDTARANFNYLGRIFQMRTQLGRTTIAIGAAAVGTLCWLAIGAVLHQDPHCIDISPRNGDAERTFAVFCDHVRVGARLK